MPAAGFVVVSSQPSRAEAELVAGLLRSAGMNVLVEGAVDAEYPTNVTGGYRVTVPADRAAEAQQLLTRAEHTDPADPGSALDVGAPVDEDVRDYLAWKGEDADDAGEEDAGADSLAVTAPEHVPVTMTGQRAGGLPLLPVLLLAAVVVALVWWLR